MHISKICVFNYKSLIYQIINHIISPGINIITGINGSGKTNFLGAIEILFFEKRFFKNYKNIANALFFGKYDKKSYSFIQICIENKERHFPIPCDEIVIKRIKGFKIDKILVNNHLFSSQKFLDFLILCKLDTENLISYIEQGGHSFLKYNNPFQKIKLFKKKITTEIYEKYRKRSTLFLEKTNLSKKRLLFLISELQKKIRKVVDKLGFNRKRKKIKKFLFLFFIICIRDKKTILKNKIKKEKAGALDKKNKIFLLITRIIVIKSDKTRLKCKKKLLKQNKKTIINDKYFRFHFNGKKMIKLLSISSKLEIYFSFFSKESDKNKWTIFSEKFFISNFKIHFKTKIIFQKSYFLKENFQKTKIDIIYKKEKNFKYILQFYRKNNFFSNYLELFFFFNENRKKNQNLFYSSKFNKFYLRRKIHFFLNEIYIEKEILQKALYKKENKIEIFLGNKATKGIRNILILSKNYPELKSKVFGVFTDLISVHKYFSKCAETFLKKFLNYIVIKDQNSAMKIITIMKKKYEFKINFLINEKKLMSLPNLNTFQKGFPLIIALFFNLKFELLIRKIVENSFIVQRKFIYNNFSKNKFLKFITIDGKFYDSSCIFSSEYFSDKEIIFDTIKILKKERIFFDWINSQIKEGSHFSQNYQISFFNWWSLDFNYKKFLEYFQRRITLKKEKKKTKLLKKYNYSKKTKEKNFIFFKKIKNFKKFNFLKKIQGINLFPNFYDKSYKNSFFKFMSFLYTKVFFFEKSFFFGFCAWTFCVKKKKRNLNFKIHNIYWLGIQERKRTQTFNHPNHYFWAKKKFWFELLFFLITLKKKNFKSLELLKTLKKILNQEFKSIFKHKKKTQKKEYCFFFRAYFKNFVYFQKFNYKKKKVEFFLKTKHKRLFQHKIYTAIWYFREVETDVIVINQTFSIFEKKKDKFLKQSIEIISNKFFGIFKTVTNGGKGFLILHFKENILKNFKKKKRYEKKTTGISILAKFNKNENLNFCEQMSDGQVSFIFVLLLFAFREITKPKVYLFDEIDTNLDPQYNKVLSYSIKQLSSSQLQFFISTFKKSSILTGDRWFGIAIKKTGSKIEKILKKNAFGFVDKK